MQATGDILKFLFILLLSQHNANFMLLENCFDYANFYSTCIVYILLEFKKLLSIFDNYFYDC